MKRYGIIVALILISATLVLLVEWNAGSRFRYHGKTARAWALKIPGWIYYGGFDETTRALQALGSNAVPELATMLETTNVSIQDRTFLFIVSRLPAKLKARANKLYSPMPIQWTRINAARALGLIGPEARAAIPVLLRALDDKDTGVSDSAAYALGGIGNDSVPPLLKRLQADDSRSMYHRLTLFALARVGPNAEAAVPLIVNDLSDPYCRKDAGFALANIGPAAVPRLLEMLKNDSPAERAKVVNALATAAPADERVLAALVGAARDAEPSVRLQAIKSLGKLTSDAPSQVEALIVAFDDSEPEVRLEAIKVLGHTGSRGKAGVIDLMKFLPDQDPSFREQACLALGRIGPPARASIDALDPLVKDSDESVRMAATVALMAIKRSQE